MLKANNLSIIIFIMVILVDGCKDEPLTQLEVELNPLLTVEMVRNVNLDPGVRVDSINLDGGIAWDYTISVPEINDEKVPLVIGLHWLGEHEGEQYLRCLANPGFSKLNAIIFAPDGGEFYFWERDNYTLILTLIEYAKKYWPIDENKIVVSGYSNGGIATWYFGVHYPQIFSAAIPMASRYDYNRKLEIPFYVIHGDRDNTFPLSDTEELVSSLQNKGSNIQLFVMEGYGHNVACDYDYSLRQASDWLLNEVWK